MVFKDARAALLLVRPGAPPPPAGSACLPVKSSQWPGPRARANLSPPAVSLSLMERQACEAGRLPWAISRSSS